MLSILYGLLSGLSWGAGDFAGGLASRKLGAYRAVFYSDLIGLVLIVFVSFFYREAFPSRFVIFNAALGGTLGTFGLLMLYRALSQGRMSIAAPVSALFAALLPVVVGLFTQGWPTLYQSIGFVFALASIWLISQGNSMERFRLEHLADLRLPLLAGLGFAGYFIFLHRASYGSDLIFTPMIISRTAGTVLILMVVLARRDSFVVPREAWPIVLTNATLDVGGNMFFILASQAGRLDVSAVLSSLYPGSTVILAWLFLKEKIFPKQITGIISALIAIVMFTL
ncbi:MAG TPA: EamA family transporter [Anaerolineales bacterium]|nr:EamA family transporter [Anaerolineales bacterium]